MRIFFFRKCRLHMGCKGLTIGRNLHQKARSNFSRSCASTPQNYECRHRKQSDLMRERYCEKDVKPQHYHRKQSDLTRERYCEKDFEVIHTKTAELERNGVQVLTNREGSIVTAFFFAPLGRRILSTLLFHGSQGRCRGTVQRFPR